MPIGKRRKSSQSECSNREKQSVRMTTDPSDAGVEDKRKDTEYMCGTGDKDHYSQTTASSASGQCNAQGRSEASSSALDTPTEPSQPRPPVPKNMSTRSSTRVIKRPKRDTQSPPPSPVKKPVKEAACKTSTPETKRKRQWELWGNADKNTFFEGLYEFGKDFDAIQGHIALKCKRKGVAPSLIKNKDQVRHFYYRTWHKISKYIHFPEDVKKQTQELYGLINYGELRKKICGNLDERILQKLNELIHKGNTCLRIKGKTHKIRTPVCNALKKLNNVEEPRVEDIPDVPNKVTLEIGARTNAAWACVQDLAQNPRLRITVKATHRLAAVIAFLEKKWKSQRLRIKESLDAPETAKKELRLFPHKESQIHPVSLSRVEVQTRPEIHFDSYHQNILVKATKRARDTEGEAAGDKSESSQSATEAGSVTSPDLNRRPPTVPVSCGLLMDDENAMFPDDLVLPCRTISSSTTDDDMCTEINYSEVLNGAVRNPVEPVIADFGEKVSTSSENAVDLECMAPALEAPSVTILDPVQAEERIRRGWSSTDCENLSLAELYLMFGEGGKLQLEYEWCDLRASNVLILCQLTNLLRRLVHIATTEFSDFNKQKEESQKSSASGLGAVCEKCSSPMVNSAASKSSGNKTTSKATSSPSGRNANNRAASPESKEAVFRVPASVLTQGIPQRIPVVTRPGAKPAEMLMPPHLRAKSRGPVRKPMIVQRRLLPKSQMMTLSMVPTSSMAGTGQFLPMKRVPTTSIHNPAVIPRVIAVPSPNVSSTLLPAMDRSGPPTVKTEPVTPDLSPGGPLTSLSDPMLAVSAVTTSPALPTAATSPAPSTLNASSASTPTISGDGASVRLLASQIEADLAAVLPSHFPPEDSADPLLSTPLSAKSQGTLVTPSCSPTSPSPTHSTSHAVISPPNIPSLLDLSLSQPPTGSASGDKLLDLGIGNFNSGLTTLLDKSPGEKPTLSLSDSSQSSFKLSDFVADGQWLGSDIQEVADISLGSFLEATEKRSSDSSTLNVPPPPSLFSDTSRDLTRMDVDSTLQCMLNESSMDYAAKFADIAAQMVASSDPVKENLSHFNADIVQ